MREHQRQALVNAAHQEYDCKPIIQVDPGYYDWDQVVTTYQKDVAHKRENDKENAS